LENPRTACAGDRFVLWRQIFDVARTTPSPHNVQPWRIKFISDDTAELYIDGTRTLPDEDHTGSFLLSAMGMFLEATELAASQHGVSVDARLPRSAEWFAERIANRDDRGLILFAYLRMFPDPEAVPVYPPSLFLSRRTSRLSLHPDPVPASSVEVLTQLAMEWGHRYTHVSDAAVIEEMLTHNIHAVFTDMNVPAYRDEITKWFRFTDHSAQKHKDGLDWRCMNLSRLEFWLSARMSRVLLFAPTRAFLLRRYRKQLGNVPCIGILSGEFFDVPNAVRSGRFLLRFWLDLSRLGLYLHPYGNLVTNKAAATWLKRETGVSNAWLIFKLGFSEPPPASYRRTLDEILVASDERMA